MFVCFDGQTICLSIIKGFFCVVIKGLKSVNNLPAPSIVPPFDVRSISCSCLYQMIE